MIESPCTAKIG